MSKEHYPLEEMMAIKKNRFDNAVKVLQEKKALLEKAYEKLYYLSQDRDKTLAHKQAKLTQLREQMDAGELIETIKKGESYLKLVNEQLAEKQKKVVEQQKVVDVAQKQGDLATDDLFQKKKDLEKLELHKKEGEKEMSYQELQKEGGEQDEQGTISFTMHKREKKLRKNDPGKKEKE